MVSTLLHSFLKHVGGGAVGVGGVESASTNSQTSSVSISVTFTQTGVSITSSTISHLKKRLVLGYASIPFHQPLIGKLEVISRN